MSTKRTIHNLQDYWQTKLGVDYTIEFQKYKRICSYRYKKKLIRAAYDKNSGLVSYTEWKQGINCIISSLDIIELNEYSRFLNKRIRDKDSIFVLSQTIMVPFIIYVIGTLVDIFLKPVWELISDSNDPVDISIYTLFLLGMLIYIFFKLLSIKDDSLQKCFYEDMKEVVDEKIKEMRGND